MRCEACDDAFVKGEPIRHHWYQRGDGVVCHAQVCFSCNNILRRPRGDTERYLLPDWDTQRWYVEQVNDGKMPVSLADLADGAERGYQGYVQIRMPVDLRDAIRERVGRVFVGWWIVSALRD